MRISVVLSRLSRCKKSNKPAAPRQLPWARLCALMSLMAALMTEARTYTVFTPADGATVTGAFNVVVRDDSEPGSIPGTLEISADGDFDGICFRTTAWRNDSQWWVASVPAGILGQGRNCWRISDAGQQVHAIVSDATPVTSGDVVRDPECHILTGGDGSLYTLANLWARNEGFGNGLGEDYAFPGRAAAGLAVTDRHLIVPEFRLDYTDSPQTFRVYDRFTGKDAGVTSIEALGNFAGHRWNQRRFEEAGNDAAGNCWIGSAFNVCDNTKTTPFGNNQFTYYSEVLSRETDQYLLVETVDFSDIAAPSVTRRIKLILPESLKSDDNDKYIVGGLHVRGDLSGTDFEIYAGAFRFTNPGPGGHTLVMLKWRPADTDRGKTTVTIRDAGIYESDRLLGQNAQFHFIDDSHFVLNSTDYSYITTGPSDILTAHPALCVAGSENGYTFVSRIAGFDIDDATLESLQAESQEMREQGGPNAQRPQTGSAIHAFSVGANTFVAYSYTMQPRLQLALRGLTADNGRAAGDYTAGAPVLFPANPWPNIYMSTRPVGIGAIRTVPDSDGTDMYLYMPPSTLARYRISPARSTAAAALTAGPAGGTIIRTGNTLVLTGSEAAAGIQLHITDSSGRTILSAPAGQAADISALPPGIYIAHAPGASPLKFRLH